MWSKSTHPADRSPLEVRNKAAITRLAWAEVSCSVFSRVAFTFRNNKHWLMGWPWLFLVCICRVPHYWVEDVHRALHTLELFFLSVHWTVESSGTHPSPRPSPPSSPAFSFLFSFDLVSCWKRLAHQSVTLHLQPCLLSLAQGQTSGWVNWGPHVFVLQIKWVALGWKSAHLIWIQWPATTRTQTLLCWFS